MDRRGEKDTPIRGPEWTSAQFLRSTMKIEKRESKQWGFKKFKEFVDSLKKGVDDEAAETVKNSQGSHAGQGNRSDTSNGSISSIGEHTGAFAFLNDRKQVNMKNKGLVHQQGS